MEPNNTNNSNHGGLIGIIIVLLIIALGAGTYLYYNKAEAPVKPDSTTSIPSEFASTCGIIVDAPKNDEAVSFPVTVTGRIDNTNAASAGCSWGMFEGQGGVATLHYETKDGWSLPVDTKPIMVDEWMTTKTNFTVTLNFNNATNQFPSGYNFKIILTEDNASGLGVSDMVEIPVVLK